MSAEALYERSGAAFAPGELTIGPWYRDAQHGGPPAALLAWAVENHLPAEPRHTARLTIDLLRPVPLTPLTVTTVVVRSGRRARIVQASLRAGDVEVARAAALQLQEGTGGVPPPPGSDPLPVPPADGVPLTPQRDHPPAFHRDGVELRFTRGALTAPGDGFAWIRLRGPVIAGEPVTPLQRVAAAADFGNAVGSYLEWRDWYFVNPDLTIYVYRPVRGEWVGLESTTRTDDTGVGLAESALYDTSGRVGRSLQSLLVWPREG